MAGAGWRIQSAFRGLMRARELAFQGDVEMLVASRYAIRDEFTKNGQVTDQKTIQELLQGASEAEDMLRHQLVQGKRQGDGEYELRVEERHTSMDPNKPPGMAGKENKP